VPSVVKVRAFTDEYNMGYGVLANLASFYARINNEKNGDNR